MCPTVAPLARGGRGYITGNVAGQCFTSPSPYTHVQGAYGALTGAVGGAADRVVGACDGVVLRSGAEPEEMYCYCEIKTTTP